MFCFEANHISGTCHLKFFPNLSDMGKVLDRMAISEDDVARQQAQEDLQLYGSRPEPPDVIEVDEATQLTGLPPKRSALEFAAAVDRPSMIRKKSKSQTDNFSTVTAIDWNSGASPLDSWLNQSAIPSSTVAASPHIPEHPAKDPVAREVEEIKVFRNIHIGVESKPERPSAGVNHDFVASMELGAQIYYRNIMDRYPMLPAYLACRLAQANHARAERLRAWRHDARPASMSDDTKQVKQTDIYPQSPHSFHSFDMSMPTPYSMEYVKASKLSSIPDLTPIPPPKMGYGNVGDDLARLGSHDDSDLIEARPREFAKDRYSPNMSPSSDFWTGRSSSHRPSSIRSCSSSRNSSLRGDNPAFDLQEQEPAFVANRSRSSSFDFDHISPGLPPPPTEIGKKLSFECDICGNTVHVKRRQTWQ